MKYVWRIVQLLFTLVVIIGYQYALAHSQTLTYEFRGLRYIFPASHSSGVLTNNGSGTLTWAVSATTLPSGMGMMYTSGGCPAGWTESTAAKGRYLVARANAGTVGGTVGSAMSDLENRTHTHTISSDGTHSHGGGVSSGPSSVSPVSQSTGDISVGSSTHGHTISSDGAHSHTGATGTNSVKESPFIQFAFCVKD